MEEAPEIIGLRAVIETRNNELLEWQKKFWYERYNRASERMEYIELMLALLADKRTPRRIKESEAPHVG